MPERHPPCIAATLFLLTACGGGAPEPQEPPPAPASFVMTRPPQAAPAPRPSAAPVPAASTPRPAAAPPVASAPTEPATRCPLSGRVAFPANTVIQNPEGRAIARFSGAESAVSVTDITLASAARARIETGSGRGNVRVRGFVDAKQLPAYTTQSVPIFAGHLWIGAHRSVAISGATADGKIKVQKIATMPLRQTFTAWTSCSALTLSPGTPPGFSPAGDARGYVLKKGTIELFDAPNGNSVGALSKAPELSGVLFFSSESSGGWVHVEHHGEIDADGWARSSDLSALPRGETMDELFRAPPSPGPARLAVPGTPRVVRVTKDVPLRAAAKDTELPIGLLEPDSEVYVMDIMAGWVSVMPKALEVIPPDGGQFWVKKSELGI